MGVVRAGREVHDFRCWRFAFSTGNSFGGCRQTIGNQHLSVERIQPAGRDLFVLGFADKLVARVEVHFANGDVEAAPVVAGTFLLPIPRQHLKPQREVAYAVAYDHQNHWAAATANRLPSAHASLSNRGAGLADRQALVPGDVGLVDAAQRSVSVVLPDDVLALFEGEAVVAITGIGSRLGCCAWGAHRERTILGDDARDFFDGREARRDLGEAVVPHRAHAARDGGALDLLAARLVRRE